MTSKIVHTPQDPRARVIALLAEILARHWMRSQAEAIDRQTPEEPGVKPSVENATTSDAAG